MNSNELATSDCRQSACSTIPASCLNPLQNASEHCCPRAECFWRNVGIAASEANPGDEIKLQAIQSGVWEPWDAIASDKVMVPKELRNEPIAALNLHYMPQAGEST